MQLMKCWGPFCSQTRKEPATILLIVGPQTTNTGNSCDVCLYPERTCGKHG
jgi:hypothetical protein